MFLNFLKRIDFNVILLILPAFLISPIRNLISDTLIFVEFGNYYLDILTFLLFPILVSYILYKGKNFRYPSKLNFVVIFYFSLSIPSVNNLADANIILSIIIPLIIGGLLVYRFQTERIYNSLKNFLILFHCYIIVNIILFKVGYLPENDQNRMGGSYAEIVSLSYTLLVLLPLYISFFKQHKKYLIFSLITILYAILLTETRLSIYIAGLYLLLALYKSNLRKSVFVWVLIIIVAILYLLLAEFLILSESSRIFSLGNYERIQSLLAGTTYFLDQNFWVQLVGSGVNNFYPYFEWYKEGQVFWDNKFYYKGLISLVQPHNSYLWILIDFGLIGLILMTFILLRSISFKHPWFSFEHGLSYCGVFVAICYFFDSTLVLYPNVTILFWFLIFLRKRNSHEAYTNSY